MPCRHCYLLPNSSNCVDPGRPKPLALHIPPGAALPMWALLFGDLVNAFGNPAANFMDEIIKLSLAFFYLALGAFVASYMQMAMWMWVGSRQARAIRIRFLKSVLDQDIAFFDTDSSTGKRGC